MDSRRSLVLHSLASCDYWPHARCSTLFKHLCSTPMTSHYVGQWATRIIS